MFSCKLIGCHGSVVFRATVARRSVVGIAMGFQKPLARVDISTQKSIDHKSELDIKQNASFKKWGSKLKQSSGTLNKSTFPCQHGTNLGKV